MRQRILIALAVVAAAAAVAFRRQRAARPLVIAACLGLANAACTTVSQPANMYQLGANCSFRRDIFRALVAGDDAIAPFDPTNRARWKSPGGVFLEPNFDGHGWCTQLPLQGPSNSVLLTHYFYTTTELARGYPDVQPLGKVTLAGTSPAEINALTADIMTGLPAGYHLVTSLDWARSYKTFTQYIRGYDVVTPSGEKVKHEPPPAP